MPDLLLELFSEEIPARMQARAADDLRKMITDRLVAAGLVYEGAKAFATPRRLALAVQGVPAKQPDVKEERKGPRVGAPENAIAGFLKAAGLTSIDQAKVVSDAKKGEFYVAVIEKPGRAAIEVIAEIIPEVVRGFPWPKSMRWGAGNLTWVRPLHSIVATFGPETEEPEIVRFSVDGIEAGDVTRGHRFLAPDEIKVRRLDDYVAKLAAAKVVLDPARRADIILHDAKHLAFAQGFELIEDAGLLAEVSGLVEWPVVLMGSFDEAFLAIPPEVIRTTIRNNQKCFVLRDPATAKLANRFILTANTEAIDGGAAIVAGNERVIRARLSDAKFFYETDLKVKLEDRLEKLKEIVFHEKLGTQYERVERIERLARMIGEFIEPQKLIGKTLYGGSMAAYHNNVQRAAHLCKADLVTEMVGEFPELQGLMGKYYALAQGEDEAVAHAIEEHYKPLGPGDSVPTNPVSVAVALADKIDILVGFWAIDERPTGSKDPYALRRAALGVIRLLLDHGLRFKLQIALRSACLIQSEQLLDNGKAHYLYEKEFDENEIISGWVSYREQLSDSEGRTLGDPRADFIKIICEEGCDLFDEEPRPSSDPVAVRIGLTEFGVSLLSFFADRLKVQLREQGARHDLVDAVFALEGQDDLFLIVHRIEALGKFLDSDDGKNLLAGYKRATNIIRIEEKKDNKKYIGAPDRELYQLSEEEALAYEINRAKIATKRAVEAEDFEGAMGHLARLRPFVDAFFDKVTVNVPEAARRENRLKLLNEIREATGAVADFSKIEG